jgi:sigma-E factor negative regulatory protein RseC
VLVTDAEETVKVSFVKNGYAYVVTDKASACGSCASKSSCGSLNFFSSNKDSEENNESGLKVLNTLNLKAGDSAILSITSDKLLLGTLLLYILPLFSLLLFASMAKNIGGELTSMIAGISGFFLTLLIVRNILKNEKNSNQFEPTLVRKIIKIASD